MFFLHSMYRRQNNHAPASIELMCGTNRPGLPALGAWLTYGLGSLNQDLPSYVVMHDTRPRGDDQIWSAGFLPKTYQALALDARRKEAIDNLLRDNKHTDAQQRAQLDLLKKLNQHKLKGATGLPVENTGKPVAHEADAEFAARIESFELAYRMQQAAPEAIDVDREPEHIHKLYGIDNKNCTHFAKQCLIARRMVERGVRFVQIYSGGMDNELSWDGHANIAANHRGFAQETDQPIAALLADLKQRGLLDSTLIIWAGEFGRLPIVQKGGTGRDHNPHAFTAWLAGGGVKPGVHYGATDDVGFRAVESRVSINDFHATILALLGLEHTRLTFRLNGRDFRLTDVAGRVVKEVIA
jgi:hypothetical protein